MKLYSVKLLTITCEILAQTNIIDILQKHGVSGYTFYEVGGNGSKGIRGQGFQSEKNIKIEVILQEKKLSDVLEEIARTLFSDYTIITYVSDVGVVRIEKFS
jgi:nitrogen regulatory protein PII